MSVTMTAIDVTNTCMLCVSFDNNAYVQIPHKDGAASLSSVRSSKSISLTLRFGSRLSLDSDLEVSRVANTCF